MKYCCTLLIFCSTYAIAKLPSLDRMLESAPSFEQIPYEHAKSYIEQIYPQALRIEYQTNIPHPIILAIACLESRYGQSYIATKNNNHFGLRDHKHPSGYCYFDKQEHCFDYFRRLMSKPRYKHIQALRSDNLTDWAIAIQQAGYNPKPRYVQKIMRVITHLKLDEIRSEQERKQQHNFLALLN